MIWPRLLHSTPLPLPDGIPLRHVRALCGVKTLWPNGQMCELLGRWVERKDKCKVPGQRAQTEQVFVRRTSRTWKSCKDRSAPVFTPLQSDVKKMADLSLHETASVFTTCARRVTATTFHLTPRAFGASGSYYHSPIVDTSATAPYAPRKEMME